jgi:DNA repair protein RadC
MERERIKIETSRDVYELMLKIIGRRKAKQVFWIIGLNEEKRIILIEEIRVENIEKIGEKSIGKRANSIIICQNKMLKEKDFDKENKVITEKMIYLIARINLEVIDYIIVSKESYISNHDYQIRERLKRLERRIKGLEKRIEKEE